jgi:hypothetical protein
VCVCVCERERETEPHTFIECASEAKVSTLGGNCIIHCEENNPHEHMSNSELLLRQTLFIVLVPTIHNKYKHQIY